MKFTKAQMQFIKSKFPSVDEVEFLSEALEFTPKKKVMKEVPEEERCNATKKDGQRCTKRHTKDGDKCTIHEKTLCHSLIVPETLIEKVQCKAITKKGDQCKKRATDNGMCSIHCQSLVSHSETMAPVLVC